MEQPNDWLSENQVKEQIKIIRKRSITIAIVAVLVILGIGIFSLAQVVETSLCGNQIIYRESQPQNGKYELVLFTRDCRATTGHSYQMSIIHKGKELDNKEGNVFSSYDGFEVSHYSVKWIDKNTIELVVVNTEKIKRSKIEYKGIRIIYKSP
ncbi:DUF5412 family protein [Paenibacillus sp. S-12]|uniref:DUF5412 family protein n=1 Tax=Paenibacillus sp. S-12 TaxID=3031371 RepID=UPI0025A2C473|nr:DUF5412 family protein [Paenibacillus sp. S-12]